LDILNDFSKLNSQATAIPHIVYHLGDDIPIPESHAQRVTDRSSHTWRHRLPNLCFGYPCRVISASGCDRTQSQVVGEVQPT